ncbi:MAG: glycoside-pentoside-hexuronide (GPH):cation symporter [Clostridia bacterium]|nr:glycoside-pentoside-hexuronide (GPH):cation symporter [Clostridia bacterium]
MEKVPMKQKLGYGVGAIGLDLSYGLFYSYLSLYLTNALGISPVFLLILAPIARIWDGINDPMMGTLVDRTRTKMGKYRPWILLGAMLNAIVLCLLFNNPGIPLNSVGLYIYVTVLYVLWGMTNTLADIPFWSMIPSFASEEKERNTISTIARTFSGLGQGIIVIFTAYAVAFFGKSEESSLDRMSSESMRVGFGKWAIVAAVLLVFFAGICVLSTREKNVVVSEEKFSFKKALGVIKKNDQLLTFMLFAMISNAGYYMTSGISSYYFNSVAGDLKLQSTFNLFGSVGSILGLAVIPVCSKFMTNRSTYKLSLSLAAVGYIGMAIIGYGFNGNVYGLGLCYLITSVGIGSMFVNQTVMLADVVDYGEYKLGTRNQSLTFSMKGFLQKMAYTIQCIIMYLSFSVTGYDGTLTQQPKAALDAISAMMFIVPPVMIIISLLIFSRKYKIYGEFKQTILSSVTEKRNNEAD